MSQQRSPSTDGQQRSLSRHITAIGAKINRAISGDNVHQSNSADTDSVSTSSTIVVDPALIFLISGAYLEVLTLITVTERSQSRGRDGFRSSGRGGLGNIRPLGATSEEGLGAEFISSPPRDASPQTGKIYSFGRGGVGNIRSSADGVARDPSNSRSPDASRSQTNDPVSRPPAYSTGRGGAGNIKLTEQPDLERRGRQKERVEVVATNA